MTDAQIGIHAGKRLLHTYHAAIEASTRAEPNMATEKEGSIPPTLKPSADPDTSRVVNETIEMRLMGTAALAN